MGSMNFSCHPLIQRHDARRFDREKDYVEASDTYIFRNTFRDIANVASQLGPLGTKFEHECYDVGHHCNLRICTDQGMFKAPIFNQFIFGILGGIGPEVDNLVFMKRTADRLFGDDSRWSVLGAGGAQLGLATMASQIGGSARSAASSKISAAKSPLLMRRARFWG